MGCGGIDPGDGLQAVWGEMQRGIMPRMPNGTPKRFVKLIASLLVCDDEQRPSAAQTLAGAAWLLEAAKGGVGLGGGVGAVGGGGGANSNGLGDAKSSFAGRTPSMSESKKKAAEN